MFVSWFQVHSSRYLYVFFFSDWGCIQLKAWHQIDHKCTHSYDWLYFTVASKMFFWNQSDQFQLHQTYCQFSCLLIIFRKIGHNNYSGSDVHPVHRYVTSSCYSSRCPVAYRAFNSSPPGQNGHHFADNIFRCIFVNEKFCMLIKI